MDAKKMNLYKYEIELSIDVNGMVYPINTMQILRLLIERDYDNDVLPVILLDLNLPLDWYHKIRENKLKSYFILKIYKLKQISDGVYNGKSLCISDKFVAIIDDDKPFMDKKTYETVKYGSGFKKNDMIPIDLKTNYTFILVKESDLLASKNIVNDVIQSCNLTTAIAYILNKSGIKKVLMSKLDNTLNYNEFLLLPIPLANQLRYMNSFYGFYKNGAQIFFDLDCLYILNNTAKCTAWRKQELTQVVFDIEKPNDGKDAMSGSYVDDEEKLIHIKVSKDEIEMIDSSTTSDNIQGNNSIYINTNQGSSTKLTSTNQQLGNGNYNIKMSSVLNPYVSSEAELRTRETMGMFNLMLSNIDISIISPNKEFKMATTLTEITNRIKGKFRLSKHNVRFIKTGDKFDSVSNIEIRRTDNS